MKLRLLVGMAVVASTALAATATSLDGEYNTKTLHGGADVFEFSVHQSGSGLDIGFDAAHSDGHGAAPDATGTGKITGPDSAQFTWSDSFNNSGSGTIKRTADGIVVTLMTKKVVDARCLEFYAKPLALKRVGKK